MTANSDWTEVYRDREYVFQILYDTVEGLPIQNLSNIQIQWTGQDFFPQTQNSPWLLRVSPFDLP